jgi:hypothetical protein
MTYVQLISDLSTIYPELAYYKFSVAELEQFSLTELVYMKNKLDEVNDAIINAKKG